MQQTLADPFYYLGNFQHALDWVSDRYSHLLNDDERAFAAQFPALPQASRALLVRMVMRKGSLFRASKLLYPEIGCPHSAARTLIEQGWIDADPQLALDELFAVMTKTELAHAFSLQGARASLPKAAQLEALREEHQAARSLREWWTGCDDHAYRVLVDPLCERLRLLFFGNGYQGWTEFVLADLGIYRYEKVALSANALGFRTRADIETYLQLQRCRERLALDEPADAVLPDVPAPSPDNPWLDSRRAKLLFAIGQQHERQGALEAALMVYAECVYPGARQRRIRVLEKLEQFSDAWQLACTAETAPENESERQQVARMLPRLRRKLGLPKQAERPPGAVERIDLVLPRPRDGSSVEQAVAAYFAEADSAHRPAPVHYVENTLINSLFGLLCWRAVFAPLPGAFFHPFHSGPADLNSPDFHARRASLFEECIGELESARYRDTINRTYAEKFGILSPFVFWSALDEQLKDIALDCIPAPHLKACFGRMLLDVRNNCAGLPDLMQFYPEEKRYRMIEVKGPGDRLQDNQIRWLDYFARHDIPVAVCYVKWTEDA